jgi:ABC-type branched-subunit amino acid transport system substrate-binding protein
LTDFSKPIRAFKKEAGIGRAHTENGRTYLPFEALFLPGYAEQVGLIVPQLVFHDIDTKRLTILGGSELNTPRFPEIGERYADGVFFADGFFAGNPRLEVQRFVALFRRVYGEDPGTFAAQAYDAAAIVADILRRGEDTREGLLRALGEVIAFQGVTGSTSLVPGGYSGKRPFFGTVEKGRLIAVDTGR